MSKCFWCWKMWSKSRPFDKLPLCFCYIFFCILPTDGHNTCVSMRDKVTYICTFLLSSGCYDDNKMREWSVFINTVFRRKINKEHFFFIGVRQRIKSTWKSYIYLTWLDDLRTCPITKQHNLSDETLNKKKRKRNQHCWRRRILIMWANGKYQQSSESSTLWCSWVNTNWKCTLQR